MVFGCFTFPGTFFRLMIDLCCIPLICLAACIEKGKEFWGGRHMKTYYTRIPERCQKYCRDHKGCTYFVLTINKHRQVSTQVFGGNDLFIIYIYCIRFGSCYVYSGKVTTKRPVTWDPTTTYYAAPGVCPSQPLPPKKAVKTNESKALPYLLF